MERDEKFWSAVDICGLDECWEWTKTPSQLYGIHNIKIQGRWKVIRVNRYAWLQSFGEIPEDAYVCHTCDNKRCCNPAHLWLGTNSQNQKDAVEKHGFWNSDNAKYLPKGEDHHSAKLTEDQVREIRRCFAAGDISQAALARKFGVSPPAIRKIVLRRSWKNI